jgi:hypothetical protein
MRGYIRWEHPTDRFGVCTYVDDVCKEVGKEANAELSALMDWFNENLESPARMVPFRRVERRAKGYRWVETTAICWFREEASEHVRRARLLAASFGADPDHRTLRQADPRQALFSG